MIIIFFSIDFFINIIIVMVIVIIIIVVIIIHHICDQQLDYEAGAMENELGERHDLLLLLLLRGHGRVRRRCC